MKAQLVPDNETPLADDDLKRDFNIPVNMAARKSHKEATYLNECYENTGKVISEEKFRKLYGQRQELYDQSCRIADILEHKGVNAYSGNTFTILGLCSGKHRTVKDFRNIVFIPVVAKRKRSKFLKALEYWLDKNPRSRMWVVTAGERCTISKVRETTKALHRKISRLNNQDFLKDNGITIAFRSTELGSVERNKAGEATFHIHSHLIVQLDRYIPKREWITVLSKVRSFMGAHFKEAQTINKAREACKYCVKPADLEQLHPSELKQLYEATFRLHLVQALGTFKELLADIKEQEVKPVKKEVGDSFQWTLQSDWNKGGKRRKQEPGDEVFTYREKDDEGFPNNLVAKLAPGPFLSEVYEPVACIVNFNGNPREIMEKWNLSDAKKMGFGFYEINEDEIQKQVLNL